MVTIKYSLSQSGQKASILAGGNGKAHQSAQVTSEHQLHSTAVSLATIDREGNAVIDLTGYHHAPSGEYVCKQWDTSPTIEELIRYAGEIASARDEREKKEKAAELASLLASPPASLIAKSMTYGWRLRDEASNHPEVIGDELISQAQAEAKRRNAADNAERAKREAEQKTLRQAEEERKKKEKEAAEEKLQAEIAAWASQFGSDRLKRCVEEKIKCGAIYKDERLQREYPGWKLDGNHLPKWEDPRNPPEEAIELLDQARASLPAEWTEEQRRKAELVFWSAEDEDGDRQTGYSVILSEFPDNWLDDTIVYGYDGPV